MHPGPAKLDDAPANAANASENVAVGYLTIVANFLMNFSLDILDNRLGMRPAMTSFVIHYLYIFAQSMYIYRY